MAAFSADIVALIARLEKRAADGELFARLALPGWRAELRRIYAEMADRVDAGSDRRDRDLVAADGEGVIK